MPLLSHTSAAAIGSSGLTTGAIDTRNATLLVVAMHNIANDDTGLLSDSAGNTWVYKTALACDASRFVQFAYCINPTTSATHTFTLTGTFYPVIAVSVFDNTPGGSFDAITAGAFVSTPTATVQPGSLTPANTKNLLVTLVGGDLLTSASVDSGFTITDTHLKSGGTQGLSMAYLIQTAANAKNPLWTAGSEDATLGALTIAFAENGPSGTANTMDANPGSYALTGAVANGQIALNANAVAGSYAINGAAATLVNSGGTHNTMQADPGVYSVTGVDFALANNYNLNAVPGAYTITGLDATLNFGHFPIAYELNCAPGNYVQTGALANGQVVLSMAAIAGAYQITGRPATLKGPHDNLVAHNLGATGAGS